MNKSQILNLALALVIIVLVFQIMRQEPTVTDSGVTATVVDTTHVKKSIGKRGAIYPKPALVIGSYNEDGVPNIMAAAWAGIANSKPMSIAVSLRPATLSYHNITRTQAFTVNVPSAALTKYVDYVGQHSGHDIRKFEKLGLTAVKGDSVNAPYIHEFPIVIECKVTAMHDLGSHRQFIGEVVDTKVDLSVLDENGRIDMHKLNPIMHGVGGYYSLSEFIGKDGVISQQVVKNK